MANEFDYFERLKEEKIEDFVIFFLRNFFTRLIKEEKLEDIKHNVSVFHEIVNFLAVYAFKDINEARAFLAQVNAEIERIRQKYQVSEASLEVNRNNPKQYRLIYAKLCGMYLEIKNYLMFVASILLKTLKPPKTPYIDYQIETVQNPEPLLIKIKEMLKEQLKKTFVPVFIRDEVGFQMVKKLFKGYRIIEIIEIEQVQPNVFGYRGCVLIFRKKNHLVSWRVIRMLSTGDLALIQSKTKNAFIVFKVAYNDKKDKYFLTPFKVGSKKEGSIFGIRLKVKEEE